MDNAPSATLGLSYPPDLSSPAWSMSIASGLSPASCFGPFCCACSPPSLPAAAEVLKSCMVPQRRISSSRRGPLDEALFLQQLEDLSSHAEGHEIGAP